MKPVREWDEDYVLKLPLGEFDWFEAKGRKALDLTLLTVKEQEVRSTLSKAVSAFANSGGGTMVYGLENLTAASTARTVDDGGIAVVSRKGNTREWLETIIPNLVDPPLSTFNVYAVPAASTTSQIQSGRALYLVDIPDSELAPHQASDYRYYARVGGRSCPISHRLVADIMGRRHHPKIELDFEIRITTRRESRLDLLPTTLHVDLKTECTLRVFAKNTGRVYAQYVNAFLQLPVALVPDYYLEHGDVIEENGQRFFEFERENTVRDVVDVVSGFPGPSYNKYGPSRFDPILPGLRQVWEITLRDDFESVELDELTISWCVYADNSTTTSGDVEAKDIRLVDRREVSTESGD